MTLDNARQEYVELMNASGLTPGAFKAAVVAKLNGKGSDATPEDYLEAAKLVLADLQPTTETALPTTDPLPDTTYRKETAQILKLKPSRFVCINVQIKSPNHRRELERNKTAGMDLGVESVTIKVTTEHTIVNPKEHAEAKKVVGEVSYKLRKLGMRVQDGVVAVPLDCESEWDETRLACKQQAFAFNRTSVHHKVIVNAIKLQAMVGEEELMARKLAYEIQQIMNELKDALASLDPDKIRAVALEAKYRAMNLAPGLQRGALEAVVSEARKNANKIADETKNKSVNIEAVKRGIETSAVDSARMMFLDFAVPEEVSNPTVETSRFSNLEL